MSYDISIIIPVYNVENYIKESLDSIINQNIGLKNLEVIMVNDCSTDNSGKIIDEYSSKYSNFKSIHLTENSGAAGKPRNVGMEHATGKYLMFLDSDDTYEPHACKTLYNVIENENVDIVFSRYNYVYTNRISKSFSIFEDIEKVKVDSIEDEPRLLTLPPSVWTKIFKKRFIKENNIKFPEGIPAQDLVFVVHTFIKSNGIILLNNQSLFNYNRIRDSIGDISTSREKNKKTLVGMIKAYNETFYLLKKYKKENLAAYIFRNNLQFWMNNFIKSDINIKEKKEVLKELNYLFNSLKKSDIPEKKYFTFLFQKIKENEYEDALSIIEMLKEIIITNEREKIRLKKELNQYKNQLSHIAPLKGYIKYKYYNLYNRTINKLLQYRLFRTPYNSFKRFKDKVEEFNPLVKYEKLTLILPYRHTDDPDREINLDITLNYLSKIGIPNLIISEHSDISVKSNLIENYSELFESFKVIHTDACGDLFNKAKAINQGVIASKTPYIGIIDIDCLTKKKNITKSLSLLEKGYEVVHPFDRKVSDIMDKEKFKNKFDFQTITSPVQNRPWADGGIVFWNKKSFIKIGMKNEFFSGWGGEDNEIIIRADLFNLKQYRINDILYHLHHHRPQIRTKNNAEQLKKIRQIKDLDVISREIKNWPWMIEYKKKTND